MTGSDRAREIDASWRILDIVSERGSLSVRELREMCPEVDAQAFRRLLNDWKRLKEINFDDTRVWDRTTEDPMSGAVSYRVVAIRASVWDKTGGCCWYCGKQTNPFRDFHLDHAIPQSRGGSDDIANLVPSCLSCNLTKGSRTLEEFRIVLGSIRFPFERGLFDA